MPSAHMHQASGRLLAMLLALLVCAAAAQQPDASRPAWLAPFRTRNSVTLDSTTGTATLAGGPPAPGQLSPSAALLSVNSYDGDLQINVTLSGWEILQSGYQVQVSVFMAPTNYSSLIGDYLTWQSTDALGGQQYAYVRSKIYTAAIPDYTWSSLVVPSTSASRSIGAAGSWKQKGVISISRKADQVSGFLRVGSSSSITPFASLKVPTTGPVLLGVQVLYGYTYSVTVSNISVSAAQVIPPPPPPLAGPVPTRWQSSGSEASVRTMFNTRNGVSFDSSDSRSSGAVTLSGGPVEPGLLAPSAGLLSKVFFEGDFQIDITISDYRISQPGYQANIALFMAPVDYTLGDYLTWPQTDALANEQLAYIRAKIYTSEIPNYTWASMTTAGGSTQSVGTPGSWQQQGVLSLSRKGAVLSGSLQVGSSAPVPFPPATTAATGPVLLGLQMLYGTNFSATVSKVAISYESATELPLSIQRVTGPESNWRALFNTRNGVSFDAGAGSVTLAGGPPVPGYLAPSAGLLSKVGFEGDFQVNVTLSDYKILQPGYQANIALFMAPLTYQLRDYLTWPQTDALADEQPAYIRAKTYTSEIPNYTWALMTTAGGSTQSIGTPGSWQQQGVLSLSRKAAVLSGFLQVGGNPPVSFPPATTAATGPVLLGLQMLYGFNFSATISQVSVAYYRTVDAPAPPPEPSPSPKPPTVAPPSGSPGPSVQPADNCSISVLDGPAAVYEYGSGQWQPMGVGGGGATSSLSMSPYADLWLIGTDMGSVYRSTNKGQTWQPIDHHQIRMTTDMGFAPTVGFSADGATLFFAPCWDPSKKMPCVAKRSTDGGLTWRDMDVNANGATVFNIPSLPPNNKRPIRYWTCHPVAAEVCYAATTGGLDRTTDKGLTWQAVAHPALTGADARGSFLDSSTTPATMYHATPAGIFSWPDGQPHRLTTVVAGGVHCFAAGRGDSSLTLAYVDKDAAFCEQVLSSITWSSADRKNSTLSTCGRLWVSTDGASFAPTTHHSYKVVMAENNNAVVYSHPHRSWDHNYGVRVFKSVVTAAADNQTAPAVSTTKVFDQTNVDDRYALWPADKLQYSGVGLDVGYWDGGYYTFAVHPRDANLAGGSENFFLHLTKDGGATWQSPFTRFRDCGSRGQGKRWSSTGLEPTNFYKVVVHPSNPNLIYAGAADIKGIVSEDGGQSWRLLDPFKQAARNSIYAFAFDPDLPRRVFIATAKWHDFPHDWYASPLNGAGGIFVSDDAGRTFSRVGSTAATNCATGATSSSSSCSDMNNDFLSVAYDPAGGYLYAGGHINGIARIRLGQQEAAWTWINDGLLGEDLWQNETIVPAIQVDPANGDVYMLLTGIRAIGTPRNMANQARTGIYRMARGGSSWTLLRGKVLQPAGKTDKPWQYPTSFAVDWTSGSPGNRTHMLLTDFINNGQSPGMAGVWRTTNGGATWSLKAQADWALDVRIDPGNPLRVFLGSSRSISNWGQGMPGQWGYGGFMYSTDGGETWAADDSNPFQASINAAFPHPTDPSKLWYATSGLGVLLGPVPPGM